MADQKNNIKNHASPLFQKLTKLFSGPIINFRAQKPSKERQTQLDKYSSKFNSLSGLSYKKSVYNPFDAMRSGNMAMQTRAERYVDFEQMEFYPELNSALDVYADEMSTFTEITKVLKIDCRNEEIKNILDTLFYKTLNIEMNLFNWARTMCKYGDFFLFLDTDEVLGVKTAIALPTQEIERLEGEDKTNPNYVQFQWNAGGMTFENWQIAHFRILGNDKHTPYGSSVLDGARRIWRQLCVSAGEKVLTVDGPISIENIKKGDIVYCWDYETKETVRTLVKAQKHMGKQDVFSVRTNHRNINVTDKHGLLIYDGKEYFYKQAKEIKLDKDFLVLPTTTESKTIHTINPEYSKYFVGLKNRLECTSENIMSRISKSNCEYSNKNIHSFLMGKKRIPYRDFLKLKINFSIPEDLICLHMKGSEKISLFDNNFEYKVDKEFARLFGFLLGDGWIRKSCVGFATGIYEQENLYYKNLLENYSKSKSLESFGKKGINGGKIEIFNIEFNEILKQLGFITGALHKKVPSWIFGMSKEIRRDFIKGYFDADGGDADGRVSSISKELLEGIRDLSYSCGIPCNQIISATKENTDEKGIHRCDSYRMYLNMNTDKWDNEFKLEKVLSYSLHKKDEETYDLEVENDLHNFIVSGIVSHNTLVEDAMMASRVIRAPDRKVFKIDVSGIPPEDVEQHMQRVITQMKRHQVVDDSTGQVDLRYSALSVETDYYLPVRAGTVSSIEPLAGQKGIDSIDDIKYLKDKLFAAIKIPKAYLSQSDSMGEDKSTLAQKDIRFARTIQRLQRAMLSEMEKIGMVHLYTLGFRGDDIISFKLSLNNPSQIAQMQQLEGLKSKLDIAATAISQNFFSHQWISTNIFGFSKEELQKIERERFRDKQVEADITASGEAAPAPTDMSGLGGGSVGEPTGGAEEALPDAAGGLGAATAPPEPEAGVEVAGGAEAEASPLLAAPPPEAPAKRDYNAVNRKDGVVKVEYEDGSYVTRGSKGKHHTPPVTDKREDSGPRRRHIKSLYDSTYGNNSKRRTFGQGYVTSDRLAKGIAESIDTNYNDMAEKELDKIDNNFNNISEK